MKPAREHESESDRMGSSGAQRRFGKTLGRTQDWKKAYVSLAEGQAIDYEARAKA